LVAFDAYSAVDYQLRGGLSDGGGVDFAEVKAADMDVAFAVSQGEERCAAAPKPLRGSAASFAK
jgi:hypothetical protein